MSYHKLIFIPVSAIPAVKGLGGQKIRDTELVSGTSIHIKKDSAGRFKARITGPSENHLKRAEKIILLAIDHFKASIQPPISSPEITFDDLESASYDLETFIFEINNSKAFCVLFSPSKLANTFAYHISLAKLFISANI